MASTAACARPLKVAELGFLLDNRLPRGPVPPSGPSPCHNKFSQSHTDTTDYIICP
uniref:Uncharacterized protein n=1 Tax=Manihot esculenta TaxID=3983 RepID=A0A2C9UGF2_MANES